MDGWNGRWVAFDVGETLIDETRAWTAWADLLGIPRLTFMAVLGGVIARGGAHTEVFDELDLPHWREHRDELEASYGGFGEDDLYPDVRPTMDALRAGGYRLAIFGNQPAQRTADLKAMNLPVDVIAMSSEMRLGKPDPAYFARALELMDGADPESAVHVGDRLDNDIVPALAAGLRAVWLRRGPWGHIQQLPEDVRPSLVIGSLAELAESIDEVFDGLPPDPRPE
jgi:HAD superfamily hydrolase (TIGR01549 family)